MPKSTPAAAPAQGTTITVPTITTEEICQAASNLAARAKARLLEGAASEGANLAGKAIELAHSIGHAAVDELEKLEALCEKFAGATEQAPLGTPPAPTEPPAGEPYRTA